MAIANSDYHLYITSKFGLFKLRTMKSKLQPLTENQMATTDTSMSKSIR